MPRSRVNLIFISALIVLSLLASGCIFNKKTGKIGPSWQVPLRVPLIATNTNVTKLLENTVELTPNMDDVLQVESLFKKTLNLNTLDFNFRPLEIKLGAGNITTPTDRTFTITSKLDLHKILKDGTINAMDFSSGSMQVNFNSDANVEITKIEIQGKPFSNEDHIPLADLTLRQNDTIKITGTIPNGSHKMEKLTINFNVFAKDIKSITGQNLRFKLPNETVDLDFPLPSELDNVEFNQANLTLALDYQSKSANPPEINLSELNLSELKMPENASFVGKGQFEFDQDEVVTFLNKRPSDIQIGGYLTVGSEISPATISFTDTVDLEFNVTLPFQFKLSEDIVYETDATSVDVGDTSFDDIIDSIHAEVGLDYRLPLGAKIEIFVSNTEQPFNDPNAILLEASVEGTPTDTQGMTTTSKTSQLVVTVPKEITTTLKKKSYAQIRITIPVPSNELVTFTSHDFINIKAWLELWTNVNK